MNTNQIPMTAQIPSGFAMPFGMPVSVIASASAPTAAHCGTAASGAGRVAATVTATAAVDIAPVHVARERVVTGDLDVRMPFPGPASWSPPTS